MIKSLTRDDISNLTKERKIIGPELRFSKSSFGTRRTFYPFYPGQLSRGSRTWDEDGPLGTGRNERIKTVKLGEDGLSNSNRRSLTSVAVRWPSAKPSRFCTWFKNGTAVQDLDLLTSHNWADFRNFWNFLADKILVGRLIFEWFEMIFKDNIVIWKFCRFFQNFLGIILDIHINGISLKLKVSVKNGFWQNFKMTMVSLSCGGGNGLNRFEAVWIRINLNLSKNVTPMFFAIRPLNLVNIIPTLTNKCTSGTYFRVLRTVKTILNRPGTQATYFSILKKISVFLIAKSMQFNLICFSQWCYKLG